MTSLLFLFAAVARKGVEKVSEKLWESKDKQSDSNSFDESVKEFRSTVTQFMAQLGHLASHHKNQYYEEYKNLRRKALRTMNNGTIPGQQGMLCQREEELKAGMQGTCASGEQTRVLEFILARASVQRMSSIGVKGTPATAMEWIAEDKK